MWPGENCLQVWKQGWNDLGCGRINNFVCSQWICPDNHANNNGKNPNTDADITDPSINNTTNQINNQKSTSDLPIVEVAIPSGVLLMVGITGVIGCVICKRPAKKQEVMKADENPVYGVYQLTETYERQYSTNEAVDNNDYYEQ